MSPPLLLEERGPVRLLTLNRPDALNAVDLGLHEALLDTLVRIRADDSARVVVVTGAGRAFSAGGDLDHIVAMHTDVALRDGDMARAARLVRELLRFPLPVIAAVNGPAVGLGATLTTLADIVLIAEDAYLSDPHVSIGLTAADGGSTMWPWLIGLHRAKEYLFTGDRIDAATAVQLGLANRSCPSADLMIAAFELADRLAQQPAHALRTTKLAVNAHLEPAMGTPLEQALREEHACFDDPEHRDAIAKLRR